MTETVQPANAPARSNGPLAIIILLFLIVGIVVAGVRNVPGGEVGVRVNNLTRDVTLVDTVGLHFTIPYVTSFYTLDRKTRLLDMLSNAAIPAGAVERPPDDSLNIKSSEGDSVRIDVRVQYQIIPEKAVEVLRATGYEALELMKSESNKTIAVDKYRRFEQKWIWPIVRGVLSDRFNELTREEMNDGTRRLDKAELARADANKILQEKFGIEVRLITVENPTSYEEYEKIVRQRKDIDQQVTAVIEEQKQEREAQTRQRNAEEQNNIKELSATDAQHERNLADANARKQEKINNANSEDERMRAETDGNYSKTLAEADGIKRRGEAEAEGLKKLAMGLSGPKGLAVIASEIAKRMATMTVTPQPFVYNGLVQPYLMQQGSNMIPVPRAEQSAPAPAPSNPTGGVK